MADSPRLDMPYIAESQQGKATTHNEALDQLELTVQTAIADRDLATPPGSPVNGVLYIVAASPTGSWVGHAAHIAGYLNLQWKFVTPQEGWQAYIQDEDVLVRFDGSAWQVVAEGTTFLGLTDTPNTYTGESLKVVRVNVGETGLEFSTGSGGATDFTDLGDVPTDYTGDALKYVRVNAGETALEFITGGGGTFTSLTDVPASYSGQGTKLVAVNSGATALEFVNSSGGALALHRGALVKLTSNEILTTGVAEKLAWDASEYDTNAIWSAGTPTRLSTPSGYTKGFLVGQIEFSGASEDYRRLRLLKNNASFVGRPAVNVVAETGILSAPNVVVGFSSAPIVFVGGTDYFELELFHESGSDVTVIAGDNTWMALVLISAATLLDLSDTPDTFVGQALKILRVNAGETAVEFAVGTGGGSTTFIGLTDVPATFTGQALKLLRVNTGATAVEFVSPSGGGDTSTDVGASVDNEVAVFQGTTGKLLTRATETGLAKLTSGVLSTVTAPSGDVVGTTDTQTLTTKRITKRVVSMANATSFTPTGDTADVNTQANTQAVGTLTANAPSGTPTDGQLLMLRIKSTNVQTYAWNAIYRGSTALALPTTSSGASKTDYLGLAYNSADTKWDLIALTQGF